MLQFILFSAVTSFFMGTQFFQCSSLGILQTKVTFQRQNLDHNELHILCNLNFSSSFTL